MIAPAVFPMRVNWISAWLPPSTASEMTVTLTDPTDGTVRSSNASSIGRKRFAFRAFTDVQTVRAIVRPTRRVRMDLNERKMGAPDG